MEKQEHLKYPIGKFEYGQTYSLHETRKNIKVIAALPKELKKIIKKASRSQLAKPYRNGGWTVRQVIHHICDSHINAYIRMKMAATEDNPTIKPYDERAWAELESGKDASVKLSLALLKVLHKKWVDFMEALTDDDLKKGYYHPAAKRTVLLPEAIALYAWHSEHHLAHIRLVTDSKSHTDLSVKLHSMPSTETPEGAAPQQPEKQRGRPAKRLKPHEALALARAERAAKRSAKLETDSDTTTSSAPKKSGRPAKPKTDPDKPKMSRGEALALARAARAAKQPAKPETASDTTTPPAPKKSGRPAKPKTDSDKPKMSRQEVLALARAARAAKQPAKPKPDPDKPKMSRQEVLALARAARAAKQPAKPKPDPDKPKMSRQEVLALARAARAAKQPAKPKPDPDKPKMSRQEVLALARAARAAKQPAKPKPDPDKPKMSRQEALGLARAAKKTKQTAPDQPVASTDVPAPKPVKTRSKKAVAATPAEVPTQTPPAAPTRRGRKKAEPDTAPPAPETPAPSPAKKKAGRPPKEKKA